jgi:hypothetical protein
MYWKRYRGADRHLSGSVQAKDIQYEEYPKSMLENSLTRRLEIKSGQIQAEVGYFAVCKRVWKLNAG